jgi:hypothetical protein
VGDLGEFVTDLFNCRWVGMVFGGFIEWASAYGVGVDGVCVYGVGALEFGAVFELFAGKIFFTGERGRCTARRC